MLYCVTLYLIYGHACSYSILSSFTFFFINKVHYVLTPIYCIVASHGTPTPKTNGLSELSGRSYSRRRMFTSRTFAYSPGRDHFPLSLSLVSFNIAELFGQRRPASVNNVYRLAGSSIIFPAEPERFCEDAG